MSRRAPIVVIVLGLVLAGLLVDGLVDEEESPAEVAAVDSSVFPIAGARGDLSATWYCAGGTGDDEAFADHRVIIANPTDEAAEVTLTAYGGVVAPPSVAVEEEDLDEGGEETQEDASGDAGGADSGDGEADSDGEQAPEAAEVGEPVTTTIEVGAQSREGVRLAELVSAPIVSALVESGVGGVVVEHEVSSVNGHDVKPCVTAAASQWHFAWGDTTVDARQLLVLFNPFPRDVIVDGRFSADDGVREPVRWDGLVVPARGTIAVDIGDDVTRRDEVAGTITTRSGRIVVDRILRVDSDTDRGLTVQTGVPRPQQAWVFPDGFASEEVREEITVYNPAEEIAEVEIVFNLDDPETNGVPDPIDLSLPPGMHQMVDIGADERIPVGVGHSSVVRSANGVPVVAERAVFSDRENRRGITVTTGSPVEAPTWYFAAGAADETRDEYLILVNQDPQVLAEVSVQTLAGGQRLPVADLQAIELAPGERRVIHLDESTTSASLPLVVEASEPIVAERGLYQRGEDQRGMSNAVGIPGPDGLRPPIDPLEAVPEDVDVGEEPVDDGSGAPQAPDDVDLPEPDETIVIDDPDAEADDLEGSTTTEPSGGDDDDADAPGSSVTTEDVPATEP